VIVGAAALSAIGYAISTALKSVDSAQPVVMLLMFTLLALSGIYIPESLFPAWLRDVAQVLPVRPLSLAMQAAFDPAANGGN
jgi:ABC-2 type transport system permease protein